MNQSTENRIKRVGILLRDKDQAYPLERLKNLFSQVGIEMLLLDDHPPPEELDLNVAMGCGSTFMP